MRPTLIPEYVESIEHQGFAIVPAIVSPTKITDLISELQEISLRESAISRRQSVYGIRNLLTLSPVLRVYAASPAIRSFAELVLKGGSFAVRAIYFDKTPENNWHVAWHQDLAIPVKQRIAVEGFGPWSVKAGTLHALAPAPVLEKMLTVRLHLDETGGANGALRVIPGSHRLGRMNEEEIRQQARAAPAVVCEVPKGGMLAMRPLLLHSSSSSQQPSHRRVLHLEFSSSRLPGGLEWDWA